MSELTPCNYCSFERIKKRHGDKVKTKPKFHDEAGRVLDERGVSVYVSGKFVAWFVELPKQCCC